MGVFTHFIKWCVGIDRAEGITTMDEAEALARRARGRRRLAEIGVWEGGTTKRLRSVMASDAVLYAVDPFPHGRLRFSTHRAIATHEVATVANGTVVWIRKTAKDAAGDPAIRGVAAAGGFDFVFLDALHTYEGLREDWTAWAPLVALGGSIGIHDSRSTPGGHSEDVGGVRFTSDVIRRDPLFEVVDEVDSLTVLLRKR